MNPTSSQRPAAAIRRGVAAAIFAFVLGIPVAAPAQAAPDAAPKRDYRDVLRLLDAWLDADVAYQRLPGLSAAVVVGQETVWSKGYGTIDAASEVPATPDTIYSICSISKLFTSVAVMQLWEAGKLSLDDDIGKHLPAFAIGRSDPDSGPITIRSLLTHSSGLPREPGFPYWSPPDFLFPTRDELIQKLGEQRTISARRTATSTATWPCRFSEKWSAACRGCPTKPICSGSTDAASTVGHADRPADAVVRHTSRARLRCPQARPDT